MPGMTQDEFQSQFWAGVGSSIKMYEVARINPAQSFAALVVFLRSHGFHEVASSVLALEKTCSALEYREDGDGP